MNEGSVSIVGVEQNEKNSSEGVGGVPHTPWYCQELCAKKFADPG